MSFWWCTDLAHPIGGSLASRQDVTGSEVWGNPLGHGLDDAGAASMWTAGRSLRGRAPPWWLVVPPAAVEVAVSATDSPVAADWSGRATGPSRPWNSRPGTAEDGDDSAEAAVESLTRLAAEITPPDDVTVMAVPGAAHGTGG